MIGSSLTIRFFTSTIRAFSIVCCPESSTYSDSDTSLEYVSVRDCEPLRGDEHLQRVRDFGEVWYVGVNFEDGIKPCDFE